MKHNYKRKSGNLLLLPMSVEDSESYRILRNQNENRARFFNTSVISKEQQLKWYDSYLANDSELMFSIFENGIFIGGVGIYDINIISKSAEIGRIIIDKSIAGGKGYASVVIKELCEIARSLGINILYANIKSDNIASIKSFSNAGFHVSHKDPFRNNGCEQFCIYV